MPDTTRTKRTVRTTASTKATRRKKPAKADAPTHAPPPTPDALHEWIKSTLDMNIARNALIDGHAAPFDYLVHAFFEGRFRREGNEWKPSPDDACPSPDCVVWANRGGGKTFLGALATLLDMVFKTGVQVRILAGSLEQAGHMYEHLRTLFEKPIVHEMIEEPVTTRCITLTNGSRARILAASERSVRGTRIHKIRCDEVDLFTPPIWKAAQLTTRGLDLKGPWGERVRGSVEALSTMQNPYGLMWELVTGQRTHFGRGAGGSPITHARKLFRWGIVDSLEACPPSRPCETCGLYEECAGSAKSRNANHAGHISIEDALSQKTRVDRETWKAEMLCTKPQRSDAVYPEFDPDKHVLSDGDVRLAARSPMVYLAGMDFGWRAETVILLASLDRAGTLVVEREHAAARLTIHDHITMLRTWIKDGLTAVNDPAIGAVHGVAWISIDPAGTATSDQTGKSNARILHEEEFVVRVRRRLVQQGLLMVRARLAPALARDASPLLINGHSAPPPPRLFIHARCTRLIECMQRYRIESPNASPEPCKTDGFDHACDALRYLVVGLDCRKPVEAGEW